VVPHSGIELEGKARKRTAGRHAAVACLDRATPKGLAGEGTCSLFLQ